MPDGWIQGLLVAVAAAAALALVRSRRGSAGDPPPAEDEQQDAPSPADEPDRLYRIAEALEANEAEKFADPHDILRVRGFQEGVEILSDPGLPVEQVVSYCLGTNWVLGIMASEALARRPDSRPFVGRVLANIGQVAQWPLFFRLRFIAARTDEPAIGAVLTAVRAWWTGEPVTVAAVEEFLEGRVSAGEALTFGDGLRGLSSERIDEIEGFVRRLSPQRADALLGEIARHRDAMLDPAFVAEVGRLWHGGVDGPAVHVTPAVAAHLEEMRGVLGDTAPRSLLLVGERGVGKTALRRAFSAVLAAEGWRIFETSGSELLSGTRFVGDIETRVSQLRRNVSAVKRVALFVDHLGEMATAGMSMQNPVSVLDQIWPHVRAREIFVVSEVTPEAYQGLERRYVGVAAAMKVIRVAPVSSDEAADLVEMKILETDVAGAGDAGSEVVAEALQLARSYLTHRALPGSVLSLVELATARASAEGRALGRDDLLQALTELTGLPLDILDDEQVLDVDELRREFRQRVIGQDEAVECLVERIAMLKAGLTDPRRPIGVFLFAGPTGTGKTEIAKTLATLLFGSPEQMIRLDMSEFQTSDSLPRLLGRSEQVHEHGPVSLVRRIRQQPFSVVLLDEFEKAHENVWDLFLQVFDDGRLTDRQGDLADFRHAIIILTSNLGATLGNEAGIGFVGKAGQFSSAEVLRAVDGTFRREFVNRLDKVVVFRPLSREVMRLILRKELDDSLSRRGFRSKAWAVEWEDSAIEYLLGRGFTPDLGARPLRRAIERDLLAPLSLTIVGNRTPEGEQFLFVRSDGSGLQVEFVDPDAEPEPTLEPGPGPATARELSVKGLVLNARGAEDEEAFLAERVREIASRVEGGEWAAAKARGLAEINRDDFWDRDDRYEVLDRVELMDRIESATATLRSLTERLHRNPGSASLNRRVAEKVYVVQEGIEDLDRGRPTLTYVGVRLLQEDVGHPEAAGFLTRIAEMYRTWAARRRMQWVELTPARPARSGAVIASVAGFGCHGILSREVGLHVLEVPRDESRFDRVRVRVSVAGQLLPPGSAADDLLEEARAGLRGAEERATAVVRRYREEPSPLVRDGVGGWRTGRIDRIWDGHFDVWT